MIYYCILNIFIKINQENNIKLFIANNFKYELLMCGIVLYHITKLKELNE